MDAIETMRENKIFLLTLCEWNSIWKEVLDDERISISSQQRLSSFHAPLLASFTRDATWSEPKLIGQNSVKRDSIEKDGTFFPQNFVSVFVFSFFFSCAALRPHRKSISQNDRHFNYGTPGNCKVHGNECNTGDSR